VYQTFLTDDCVKIQLKKSRFIFWKKWSFVIVSSNGEIIATSENYPTKVFALLAMMPLKLRLCDAQSVGNNGENL